MTTFYLVRHGMTDGVGHYLAGTSATGTPLNATGRQQVDRLAQLFRNLPLSAIVSSPLIRTRQTAEAIAGARGSAVQIVPAFLEVEVGDWTGATVDELERNPEWRRYNEARSLVRPPGGELMIDVQQRSVAAILDLASMHPDGSVVIVSHGDVIRALIMYFLGMPFEFVHRIEIAPASISVVTLDGWAPLVRQVGADTIRAAD